MKIQFCGAATGVTGSCHWIKTDLHNILLDCGQFQGGAETEAMNYDPFPFEASEIECVVLSHAHIDHCGRLPLMVKRGFKGDIFCTDATADLLDVMLKDSAHIHEQDAEWTNRKAQRAGRPLVEPLYTTQDAIETLTLVKPVLYDTLFSLNNQMKVVFNDAGHILGSAIIELWVEEDGVSKKLVYSGDLGMMNRPILRDPIFIKKADYLIMETTYGNRLHEANATSIKGLLDICVETTRRGGNVVIPSFAVGRTQELIFELNRVYEGDGPYREALKDIHVYVDSPMAIRATEIFKNNAQTYDEEMREFIMRGDHPLDFPNLHFTKTSDESRLINIDEHPKIIISASGMCEAGRIRHHLKHNLYNPKSSVVFVGYQAEGSLGRYILEGAKEVKLFGETIAVKAEIHNLQGFSGHADRDALFDWLSHFQKKPQNIFLVHGERDSKYDFADYVKQHLGWDCDVVDGMDEYELSESSTVFTHSGTFKYDGSSHPAGVYGGSEAFGAPEKEFVSPDQLAELKSRMADLRAMLDSVLSHADDAVKSESSTQRLVDIKNTVASIEKEVINLGSTVTKEDRADDRELPLKGELPPSEDKNNSKKRSKKSK